MKCKICEKDCRLKTHKYCSKKCYWESMRGLKNEKAPNWRGNNVGVRGIHDWLNANFGKPKDCEGHDCRGTSDTFDWAKKTDCKYEKNRSSFLRLCRSCHRRYDLTADKLKNYKT